MSISSFAELGISSPFDTTLARLEINEPTPVQAQAIPLLLAGHDLVGCAPTGTGKTAAFLLPALTRISAGESRKGSGPRVLVLTPTRELAQQVAKASQAFSRGLQRTSTVCITGGESYIHQNRLLASPYEVLVATPGRLMDQMNAGRVDLSRVEVFVLDEADRMLDMGFSEDVFAIGGKLPAQRQTVCFTATLSRDVRDLTRDLMRDPQWVTVERATTDESTIDQHVLYVDSFDHRHRLLEACLADEGLGQAIVFTSTKMHAEELAGQLDESGHAAEALHGDLNQRQRTRALNRLRRGECRVLVATDVAARGIDVSTITHVINFQLPKFAGKTMCTGSGVQDAPEPADRPCLSSAMKMCSPCARSSISSVARCRSARSKAWRLVSGRPSASLALTARNRFAREASAKAGKPPAGRVENPPVTLVAMRDSRQNPFRPILVHAVRPSKTGNPPATRVVVPLALVPGLATDVASHPETSVPPSTSGARPSAMLDPHSTSAVDPSRTIVPARAQLRVRAAKSSTRQVVLSLAAKASAARRSAPKPSAASPVGSPNATAVSGKKGAGLVRRGMVSTSAPVTPGAAQGRASRPARKGVARQGPAAVAGAMPPNRV